MTKIAKTSKINEKTKAVMSSEHFYDSLTDGTFTNGKGDNFRSIFDEIMFRNDEYFLLADFASYVEAQEKVNLLYSNKKKWAHICLVNIAVYSLLFFTSCSTSSPQPANVNIYPSCSLIGFSGTTTLSP
mgnify:CR=1 FL=1